MMIGVTPFKYVIVSPILAPSVLWHESSIHGDKMVRIVCHPF